MSIELSARQKNILEIVKKHGPITGQDIAARLSLSRAALRSDLTILVMSGLMGARPRVGYYVTGKQPDSVISGILGNIPVSEALSLPVVVRDNVLINDAIVTMFLEDVGTLIVVNADGCLEGVVSRKDMLKAAMGGQDIHRMPVAVIMTRMPNIIVTSPEETVVRAAQKLIHHQIDALPVVTVTKAEDGREEKFKVVGRMTKTNITRLFVDLVHS